MNATTPAVTVTVTIQIAGTKRLFICKENGLAIHRENSGRYSVEGMSEDFPSIYFAAKAANSE